MGKYHKPVHISYNNPIDDGVFSTGPFYTASSPILSLSATGSTYEEALANLLTEIDEKDYNGF